MSEETKIEPALTAEEWARVHIVTDSMRLELASPHRDKPTILVPLSRAAKVVAVANAALRDDDPRKITIDDVAQLVLLIDLVAAADPVAGARLQRISEKLWSYLPPGPRAQLRVERGGLSAMPPDLERKLRDNL